MHGRHACPRRVPDPLCRRWLPTVGAAGLLLLTAWALILALAQGASAETYYAADLPRIGFDGCPSPYPEGIMVQDPFAGVPLPPGVADPVTGLRGDYEEFWRGSGGAASRAASTVMEPVGDFLEDADVVSDPRFYERWPLGQRYYPPWPECEDKGDLLLAVTNTGPQGGVASVFNGFGALEQVLLVPPGETRTFIPSATSPLEETGIHRNGVYRIEASPGMVVDQFTPSEMVHSNDATRLVPGSALGTEYYAFGSSYPIDGATDFVTIIATQDQTTVEVTPTRTVRAGGGVPALPSGATHTFQLDAMEALNLMFDDGAWPDVTGTQIAADRPVAVYSGHECTRVHGSACDHIGEQLRPAAHHGVRLGGNAFVACTSTHPSTGMNATAMDRVRFLALDPQVQVHVDPPVPGSPFLLTQAGTWTDFLTRQDHVLYTEGGAILAMMYMGGESWIGDPAMVPLTPLHLHPDNAAGLFYSPHGREPQDASSGVVHNPYQPQESFRNWSSQHASIAAPLGSGVSLNGSLVQDWRPVGDSAYGCATVQVGGDATHAFEAPMGASVQAFGLGLHASYWYSADGVTLQPPPPIPPPVPDFSCTGLTSPYLRVLLTDNSTSTQGLLRWHVEWGDGTKTTHTSPGPFEHDYMDPGNHTVILTVTDHLGRTASTKGTCPAFLNLPPVLQPLEPQVVVETETLIFRVHGYDPDGDPTRLTWVPGVLPSSARFTPDASGTFGTFTWTPAIGTAGVHGPVTFRITEQTVDGRSDEASITITVLPLVEPLPPSSVDDAGDGVPNHIDTCPAMSNPGQEGGCSGPASGGAESGVGGSTAQEPEGPPSAMPERQPCAGPSGLVSAAAVPGQDGVRIEWEWDPACPVQRFFVWAGDGERPVGSQAFTSGAWTYAVQDPQPWLDREYRYRVQVDLALGPPVYAEGRTVATGPVDLRDAQGPSSGTEGPEPRQEAMDPGGSGPHSRSGTAAALDRTLLYAAGASILAAVAVLVLLAFSWRRRRGDG